MEKAEGGGKPRHSAIVAADMQPAPGDASGDEPADRGRVVAFGRAIQGSAAAAAR